MTYSVVWVPRSLFDAAGTGSLFFVVRTDANGSSFAIAQASSTEAAQDIVDALSA